MNGSTWLYVLPVCANAGRYSANTTRSAVNRFKQTEDKCLVPLFVQLWDVEWSTSAGTELVPMIRLLWYARSVAEPLVRVQAANPHKIEGVTVKCIGSSLGGY